MAQDPGDMSLGWQGCPLCHDLHILLSWCVSFGMFKRCSAEPSGVLSVVLGHVHVAVAVQGIGDKSHLSDNGCDEQIGLVVFFVCEGLCKVV